MLPMESGLVQRLALRLCSVTANHSRLFGSHKSWVFQSHGHELSVSTKTIKQSIIARTG